LADQTDVAEGCCLALPVLNPAVCRQRLLKVLQGLVGFASGQGDKPDAAEVVGLQLRIRGRVRHRQGFFVVLQGLVGFAFGIAEPPEVGEGHGLPLPVSELLCQPGRLLVTLLGLLPPARCLEAQSEQARERDELGSGRLLRRHFEEQDRIVPFAGLHRRPSQFERGPDRRQGVHQPVEVFHYALKSPRRTPARFMRKSSRRGSDALFLATGAAVRQLARALLGLTRGGYTRKESGSQAEERALVHTCSGGLVQRERDRGTKERLD
jgi:hypothetical protein